MKYLFIILVVFCNQLTAQYNSAKIYWVGHSLMSHTDSYNPLTDNLIVLLGDMATSQSKTYDHYQHTTPGSPLGWNWGANAAAWASSGPLIQPLINSSNPNYGTYDVMVITEAVNIESYNDWWWSDFYSRKFFNAAKNANSSARLFMYESWHHFHAGDDEFRPYYGPMSTFDFKQYMLDVRPVWEEIIDHASDPSLTVTDPSYSFQGTGADPGNGSDILDIKIIPTGQVLLQVLDRLDQNLVTDNWNYNGSPLTPLDFFANPLANFPIDTITTVHPTDPIDDIHPSNVQIYLNGLVHYAVVYQDNPENIPASNGVPSNIADIFKEVVWDVVWNDARTGIEEALPVTYLKPFSASLKDENVILEWSTAQENNSDHFVIEKSNDLKSWTKLTQLQIGNSNKNSIKYSHIDKSPYDGLNYYRLKQVDQDGTFTYSSVENVFFYSNQWSIYPNPTNGILNISNYKVNDGMVYVIDMLGNIVYNIKLDYNVKEVNLSELPNGIYTFQIMNDFWSSTERLVIQR